MGGRRASAGCQPDARPNWTKTSNPSAAPRRFAVANKGFPRCSFRSEPEHRLLTSRLTLIVLPRGTVIIRITKQPKHGAVNIAAATGFPDLPKRK